MSDASHDVRREPALLLTAPRAHGSRAGDFYLFVAGIFLPLIALIVESTSGICGGEFVDPLRTWMHVAAILAVPLVAGFVLYGLPRSPQSTRRLHALAYVVAGTTFCFVLFFAPMFPLGVIAIIAFGIGFLPLSPLLAFFALLLSLGRLHRRDPEFSRGARAAFLTTGVACVLFADPFGTWARLRLDAATHGTPEARAHAIDELRRNVSFAQAERVIREGMLVPTDPIAWCLVARPTAARAEIDQVLYRAFGRVPQADVARRFGQDWEGVPTGMGARWGSGARLQSSAYATDVDAAAATAETTWDFEFANDGAGLAEAVGTILLPAGAFVSGLTLWVDGQPREAGFAGRGTATRAYESIVATKRDPALVVTHGARRVRLSCFPIQPRGTMRLRLRTVAPLAPRANGDSPVEVPCFEERNFAIGTGSGAASTLRHRIEVRGADAESFVVTPTQDELARQPAVTRARVVEPMRARYAYDGAGRTLIARPSLPPAWSGSAVAIVIDGSAPMQACIDEIAAALSECDAKVAVSVIFAGDRPELLTDGGLAPPSPERVNAAVQRLRAAECIGGRDNAAALALAFDLVAERRDASIVWVHAPQTIGLPGDDALRRSLESAVEAPRVVSIATSAATDAVRRLLESARVPIDERVDGDVGIALRETLREARAVDCPIRYVVDESGADPDEGALALEAPSPALGKLAQHRRITRLIAAGSAADLAEATRLAIEARLVTPVSGAVVLERDAQYGEFGVEPPPVRDDASFSAAPEPETIALVGVALVALAWSFATRGRRA